MGGKNLQLWVQSRENGFLDRYSEYNSIYKKVVQSFLSIDQEDSKFYYKTPSEFGSIFNLEFSPYGNTLIAACEKKAVVLYDARTTQRYNQIMDAHKESVNAVKFLNSHSFATCSDDMTIALWDLRNMGEKLRSLQGHSNWVKNIDYSSQHNLLVTSGFDGSIFQWDLNSYTEQGLIYQKVFQTSGLMRCRLTEDGSKMIICTTGGYIIVIHNLNLNTLQKDLCGFRPNIYRLMQLGKQYIPHAAKFDHVFSMSQTRNRVELISDFPDMNDAEVIYSLQIHPEGYCCLSRNISYDESSEWSCVHDIHMVDPEETDESDDEESCSISKRKSRKRKHNETTRPQDEIDPMVRIPPFSEPPPPLSQRIALAASQRPSTSNGNGDNSRSRPGTSSGTNRQDSFIPDIWAAEISIKDRAQRTPRELSRSQNAYAYVYAISSGVVPPLSSTTNSSTQTTENANAARREASREESPFPGFPRTDNNANASSSSRGFAQPRKPPAKPVQKEQKIYQNTKRLVYYSEESISAKGYIKESCFSPDGRIICSPHNTGVRLLSFAPDCIPYSQTLNLDSNNEFPRKLSEVCQWNSGDHDVLCSQFNPKTPMLVTGCLGGNVTWFYPRL